MILIACFYQEIDASRRTEFQECLRRNIENDWLDEIHIFIEEPVELSKLLPENPLLANPKVRLIPHCRRATYQDLFAYANSQLLGHNVLIANADIYFDRTLAQLDGYDLAGKLLCLSRWDIQPDGPARFFEHPSSQDAWVFQTPIRDFPCDFHLGVLGCDNRLAWEAEQAGLAVSNPSRSLRAYHLHLSQVHRYSEHQRLTGPTKSIPAVVMESSYPSARGQAPNVSYASVAFRETMGYTIHRLAAGVSSHNNDPRPFTAIPEPLTGLAFTQVVAYAVSPVEVEFLTSGKLYVLVGNDWDGYFSATDWLGQKGFRERLPLVETRDGIGFEVWSLVAEAGERFVLPTQVMLVAEQLVRNAGGRPGSKDSLKGGGMMMRETIFALTSLPPARERAPLIRDCIKSWRDAGLQVRAYNHPDEIAGLAGLYDVEFVPVMKTTASVFGRHFVPIKAMLDWAAEQNVPVLLINSDIRLRMAEWELRRFRWLSNGGLCYFVRYNHSGDMMRASREPNGIDAFLFHGRDVTQFPDSFLSMGQPFWDYWVPYTFASRNLPIFAVEFPAAFHQNHASGWSWANWHRCALEFARTTEELGSDQSFQNCQAMSLRMRQKFDQRKISISPRPVEIQEWVRQSFGYPGPKIFLECGAHRGTDTEWMARIPGVTIHAFEPDPRNEQAIRANVILHRAAIAERDGHGPLILSQQGWGREWTYSSSIKQPKHHLQRYPVTFGEAIDVELVTLDTFYREHKLDVVDFIWADVQGAEGEMIRGGHRMLERTRYLYTEYSDDELYVQQSSLKEILEMLPEFRVIELWPDDVLLENRRLKAE
ncbi:MAG: FkbM family methyltransferase [Acidobacteria bacterium]|nr:FkbM family methyltransferase [Acidobacteriota bacterium]